MARIQDIDLPYLEFGEAAAPGTPAAAVSRLYVKADGLFYSKDDAGVETLVSGGAGGGSVATDAIWDAAGDLVQGTGANTAAKLVLGAAGTVVRSTGATNAYAYPPGYEFDYVQFTANVSITATTEATANVVVTSAAVTYDGSTIVLIEFFCPAVVLPAVVAGILDLYLYEKVGAGAAASIGLLGEYVATTTAASAEAPPFLVRRMTPSAASIIYSIRGRLSSGSGVLVAAGAGGSGFTMPGFIRITKV